MIEVKGTEEVIQDKVMLADSLIEMAKEPSYSSLLGHILQTFKTNSDARESAGVNRILTTSLQQYNGEYTAEDLKIIEEEGGSKIFVNLTSTKVRAAMAWIKDLLLSGNVTAFSIEPTPIAELPAEVEEAIKQKVVEEFEAAAAEAQDPGATLKAAQERKRDLMDTVLEEIQKEAEYAFKLYDKRLKDQMKEGKFDEALSLVIDDFCIFPTAILKGPIPTKVPVIRWENGIPISSQKLIFMNKRVSPFDVYPSPEASDVQTGNFIEHMRLSRKEVSDLLHIGEPYKKEAIRKVLEFSISKGSSDIDAHIENEKAASELKDNIYEANKNVFHALHFFGTAPVKVLREWGLTEGIEELDEEMEVEIEAITIGTEVVKCVINDDPLHRRPYFTASFQRRPDSFWGSSIPWQMRDIQRVCNATVRALMNNMGVSSGPMMEVNIERLADGQAVEELRARSIIQVTNDPAGGSGKAVQFFSAPSNASDLLAVYKEFEQRADDVTMIPRYAYGNERTGGAAQTASGLSMLLESASKGIKDAVRHLDEGCIVPRVELEFYYLILNGEDLLFNGDSMVVAKGSQTLLMRGAEQMRRNEFLQITANAADQEIMGPIGRASILREMASELGFISNPIPARQELKQMIAKKEAAAAQAAQQSDSMAITQMQTEAQVRTSENAQAIKQAELDHKKEKDMADIQLRVKKMEDDRAASQAATSAKLEETQLRNQAKADSDNKHIALELQKPDA